MAGQSHQEPAATATTTCYGLDEKGCYVFSSGASSSCSHRWIDVDSSQHIGKPTSYTSYSSTAHGNTFKLLKYN